MSILLAHNINRRLLKNCQPIYSTHLAYRGKNFSRRERMQKMLLTRARRQGVLLYARSVKVSRACDSSRNMLVFGSASLSSMLTMKNQLYMREEAVTKGADYGARGSSSSVAPPQCSAHFIRLFFVILTFRHCISISFRFPLLS